MPPVRPQIVCVDISAEECKWRNKLHDVKLNSEQYSLYKENNFSLLKPKLFEYCICGTGRSCRTVCTQVLSCNSNNWGRCFESGSRHWRLWEFVLCSRCPVQVAALRLTDPPPKVHYRLKQMPKSHQRHQQPPQMECPTHLQHLHFTLNR
jgi:hypothetical protein